MENIAIFTSIIVEGFCVRWRGGRRTSAACNWRDEFCKWLRGNALQKAIMFIFGSIFSLSAFASYSDDCNAEVEKDVRSAATRKMSDAQKEQIKHDGEFLCLQKTLNDIHKKSIASSMKFIDEHAILDFAYCGPDPESIGRGSQCNQAKIEADARIKNRDEKIADMQKDELVIKKLEERYKEIKYSKPLPNKKPDSIKQVSVASIAKVKKDIIGGLKDPDSVKFRDITVSKDGTFVCGEVNAKNSMGGYVGFKKFANVDVRGAGHDFMFYEEEDNPAIAKACDKQAKN